MKKKINWLQLIIVVIITEIVGVLGNILSGNASGYMRHLINHRCRRLGGCSVLYGLYYIF